MSANETTVDLPTKPKRRAWQFGLRELFVVMFVACVWSAIAGRTMFNAVFLLVFATSFAVTILVNRKCRAWMPVGAYPALLVIPLILVVAFYPHKSARIRPSAGLLPAIQGPISYSLHRATVKFRVLNAIDHTPIENADITLSPNRDYDAAEMELTDKQGLASVSATFEASWGAGPRMMTVATIHFVGTEVSVSALGYESKMLPWDFISKEESRPANDPPGPAIVIELEPITETGNP
jgi:hypothetical protein